MPHDSREFDIVVYGATGFTGRQVADTLARRAPASLRWAVAGRSRERLERVAEASGASGVIVADSGDDDALDALAAQTRVVATTAGPFSLYGTPVVDACVRRGVDYLDITGETPWVREIIDRHHERAAAEGTRVVPCCGFDSVPADLGALWVVRHIAETLGEATRRVLTSYRIRGGLNGGTLHTLLTLAESGRSRALTDEILLNPPGHHTEEERRESRDLKGPVWDDDRGVWLAPFVMAPINTRVVRRSAALAADWDEPYGPRFRYQEAMESQKRVGALALTAGLGGLEGLSRRRLGRALLRRIGPKPGQGPSEESMDRGRMRASFVGEAESGRKVFGTLRAQGDPGNRITVAILAEAALALATQREELPGGDRRGGVLTPATALGMPLFERLRQAGFHAEIGERA